MAPHIARWKSATLTRNMRCSIARVGIVLSLLVGTASVLGCHQKPSIVISAIPQDDLGGPDSKGNIAGQVRNARRGDHVILFAYNDRWWVQPNAKTQTIPLHEDGTWSSQIHLGHRYAAAVIRGEYTALESQPDLPGLGSNVVAITAVSGIPNVTSGLDHTAQLLRFGGQDWEDTFHESEYGGRLHYYLPQNAYVDDQGLHLKIARLGQYWTCSEVKAARSLGFGTYRISFTNSAALEPAVEFGFFSMDVDARLENYREFDVHLSRWGDLRSRNAEYVLQPYYMAANVHRFEIPAGVSSTTIQWSPGQLAFSTEANGHELTKWKFTAGVPPAAGSHVYFNLCSFGYPLKPLQQNAELVVNRFEYLP